jgi:hypothetical protein
MDEGHTNRRLAAILAADVVGYSRMMAADEVGTLASLKRHRETVFNPAVAGHNGRVVKLIGDGTLVEFSSIVDAVRCAFEVQQAMPERNTDIGADNRIELPIGINLGEVIVEATTSMATAATLPRGSKPWPMPAGAGSRLKTSPGRCASTGSGTPLPPGAHQRRLHRRCRSLTSRRLRCCRSPI